MVPKIRFFFIASLVLVVVGSLSGSVLAQGGPLAYGQNVTGSLSAEAPFAFYTFNGAANDFVEIQAIGISPGMQPNISLLSAAQDQLATNAGDPYGLGDGTDARITYRLPAAGTYFALVSNTTGTPGEYLFRLRGSAASAATAAGAGSTAVNVAPGTPMQIFSFNAVPGAVLMAVLTTDMPGFSYAAQVRNAQGQVVAILTGDAAQGVTFTVPAGSGSYEVAVTSLTPGVGGVVTLSLGQTTDQASSPPLIPTASTSTILTTATPDSGKTTAPTDFCTATGGNSGVNLRSGPGTTYNPVGQLLPGASLPVTGRSIDGVWYTVNYNQQTAWLFGGVVVFTGNCGSLPVIQASQVGIVTATSSQSGSVFNTATPTSQTGQIISTATATATTQAGQVISTATATTAQNTQPTATYTPTTQVQTQPTATYTYTPSYTPTPTYTPSYTPTTPPAAQVAPEDARFNNPLNIPLDNTASVLDFVSYSGGDTEDRVRWDITGMNPNVAITGGQARLVIQTTCFGEGTEHIQFFTGGQTYSCGQTIVDREVTNDSRTGSVVITAVGGSGTYVQWVLTGTATRIN